MAVASLLTRLGPHFEKEFNFFLNQKQQAETLSSKLQKIELGLRDAERLGITDTSVKKWLKELEDVSYDMENVLDEWEMAQMRGEVISPELLGPFEKVGFFLSSVCGKCKKFKGNRDIVKKMKELSDRIDEIFKEKDKYNFVPERFREFQGREQHRTDWLPERNPVYGREADENNLVNELLLMNAETQIISIVGLGGLGKTTLAKLAYNHRRVTVNFEKRVWVNVSPPFDLSHIAKEILQCLGIASANFHASVTYSTLLVHVKEALENKKFLIVLDNLWTEDQTKWGDLNRALSGAPGSKILVTTRNLSVAITIGSTSHLPLALLSDSDCWKILSRTAFMGRTEHDCEILSDIGFNIAKKLNGLPLAAIKVGSMLALTGSERQWRHVLKNPLWEYKDKLSDLFSLLLLSYTDLSPLLKRCFLSCVVYPKRSSICVDRVTMIWMAHGCLNSRDEVDEVELKGEQLFDTLAMYSFFQKSTKKDENGEDVVAYTMQDIVHEIANYLAGTDYSWIMYSGQGGRNTEDTDSLAKLRTFSATDISQEQLPLHLLDNLSSVRVFRIIGCGLQQLPEGVGNLMHVRLLDLSHNPIEELPKAVTNLYNLETLGLEQCSNLCRLPEGMDKLIKLRHLLNCGTSRLVQYPNGLETLSGLWTLSEINITEGNEMGILRNLDQLSGSLRINFRRMRQIGGLLEQVRKANLENKKHLRSLELICWEEIPDNIVDALQPPPNLESFATSGIWGPRFFSWIDTSFGSLKIVSFDGLHLCSHLPPFGKLPALEKLTISRCSFTVLPIEFFGVIKAREHDVQAESSNGTGWFRRLRKLHLRWCRSWEQWEDVSEETQDFVPIMPRLQELTIRHCGNLKALPRYIIHRAASSSILKLDTKHCTSLFDYSEGSRSGWAERS